MEKKKRIAIYKKDGITMRMDYTFVTEEEFEKSLNEFANRLKVHVDSIITYTLGNEEETEQGNAYFCPRCGAYNEYGFEPDTRMYYRKDAQTNENKPAGYFKTLLIECDNCNDDFEIQTEKFNEESKELTDKLMS